MILTGRRITAAEALGYGLVNRVVPAGFALEGARALAAEILDGSPTSVRISLQLMEETSGIPGSVDAVTHPTTAFDDLMTSHDAIEGMTAFAQKRRASGATSERLVRVTGTAAGPPERLAARRDPAQPRPGRDPGPGRAGGRGPARLSGVKERCLLAALAVHRGEAVSAAALLDALWGDCRPRTAAKTLQNYVLRVRRALAGAGDGAPSIVTLPAGYSCGAAPGMVDAGLAESLIGAGRQGMAGR